MNAYISEGVPADVAEKYAIGSAVRSVISNANNLETRITMKAARLNTTSELVEKLVGSATGPAEMVLYQGGQSIANNQFGRRGGNRGRKNNRGNYRASQSGFNNNNYFGNNGWALNKNKTGLSQRL